jgi:hypothetical protein
MADSGKTTLEGLITRYRREVARQKAAPPGSKTELEVRLRGAGMEKGVDYANFAAIYGALLAKRDAGGAPLQLGDGRLTQMVGAVMDTLPRGEGPQRALHPSQIREQYYEAGERREVRYVRKEPIVHPYRVPADAGLGYLVALSAEQPDEPFATDERAVLRFKARVSFPLTLPGAGGAALAWRIDATVARQIAGNDAKSAPGIRDRMFKTRPPMAPPTLLAALQLADDANPAPRALYQYEVEAEFDGPAEHRDLVRPADVTAAAEALLRLASPEGLREAAHQAEVYRIAQYVAKAPGYLQSFRHERGLAQLLPKALAITRADYRDLYPPAGLYLTDKADGKRAAAVARGGRGVVVADVLHEFGEGRPPRDGGETIADGEWAEGEGGVAFYAFDVIAVDGASVVPEGFERRVARLDEAVGRLAAAGIPAAAKQYVRLAAGGPSDLEPVFRAMYEAPRPYRTDGLILVAPGRAYDDTATYKWKSAADNTIDFLARRAPASVPRAGPYAERPGHRLHFLFVGIEPGLYEALGLQPCPGYADLFGPALPAPERGDRGRRGRMGANAGSYFPVQFAPSDAPYAYVYHHPDASPLGEIDGKVVEARCAGGCLAAGGGAPLAAWELVRVREDRRQELLAKRYYGNPFHVAELIWLNYVDPFPLEQLWEGPALDYFLRPKAGAYQAQTAVLSYVKSQRIRALAHAARVVDVGTGKGQDLGRYLRAGVRELYAVDRDRAALSELVRRKYRHALKARGAPNSGSTGRGARRGPGRGRAPAMTLHVLVADAGAPHAETLRRLEALGLPPGAADALVCNLAVHYFLGSVEAMRNFVALARGTVKPGGLVVITALLGEAVHALFAAERVPDGGSWDVREGGSLKYSLRRLYASETLEATGQQIGVLLPFSDGRYYPEYLVNAKALTAEFLARGFAARAATNAADSLPEFEARDRQLAAQLTPGDRRYLGLYGELVYVRV